MKHVLESIVSSADVLRTLIRRVANLYRTATNRAIERHVRELTHSRVQAGPFKGLTYPTLPSNAVHASTIPKLLGIYELELQDDITMLVSTRPYDRFIDIGAADGYYAVGIGRLLDSARTVAFEADPTSREALGDVCRANNFVDRIDIHGFCTADDLKNLGRSAHTLIVCDCEGGEVDLITAEVLTALGPTDLIIECHDMLVPHCTGVLTNRLSATHEIRVVESHERTLSDVSPEIIDLLPFRSDELIFAIGEHRHYTMNWVIAIHRD